MNIFGILVYIFFFLYQEFVKQKITMYTIAYRNRFDEKSPYYNWLEKYEWAKTQSYINLLVFGCIALKEIGPIAYKVFVQKVSLSQLQINYAVATCILLAVLFLSLRLEVHLDRFRKMIMWIMDLELRSFFY